MLSTEQARIQLKQVLKADHIHAIHRVDNGYSNETFYVELSGERFIAKYSQTQGKMAFEASITEYAYQKGIAAQVVYYDQHWLVLSYIDGILLSQAPLTTNKKLEQLITGISQFHQLTADKLPQLSTLDWQNVIYLLSKEVSRYHPELVSRLHNVINNNVANASDVIVNQHQLVVVHGDANFTNAIVDQDTSKLLLIDFEACALAEREYELAMVLAVNELSSTLMHPIIQTYQQSSEQLINIDEHKVTRYYIISLIINILWYFQQYDITQQARFVNKAKIQFQLLEAITKQPFAQLVAPINEISS